MKNLPEPTIFPECFYKPEWYEQDFFYSPDGIERFPEHHCKLTWEISKPFIKNFRNAIDIGCRDGEYTRYLFNHFQHTYCYDVRLRKYFPYNVDLSRVSHYHTALGDGKDNDRHGRGEEKRIDTTFCRLDDFKLSKIDYIKIDTDGYEMAIINGALKTIEKWSPLIVLEVFFERDTLEFVKNLGYKHVATCPRGWDHILIRD